MSRTRFAVRGIATIAAGMTLALLLVACGRTAEQARIELERAGLAATAENYNELAGEYPARVMELFLDAGIDVNATGGPSRLSALMRAAA